MVGCGLFVLCVGEEVDVVCVVCVGIVCLVECMWCDYVVEVGCVDLCEYCFGVKGVFE